jgi:hypothetical protein
LCMYSEGSSVKGKKAKLVNKIGEMKSG